MLFFYIRHGDPTYEPDCLTPLGERQAEAIARRLSRFGIDKIYSSTMKRAIQTATPTCEILKKEYEPLDFSSEVHAWEEFVVERDGVRKWVFQDEEMKRRFTDEDVVSSGMKWAELPGMERYKNGIERIYKESFEFFSSLGYEHIRNTGKYKVIAPNEERIALFAHQGFGLAFLSVILDIPYPKIISHFDMCHTGMTVIDFRNENGYAVPKILTLSSDSHLYAENLPTKYNHLMYF